jgi:hypothetical protein
VVEREAHDRVGAHRGAGEQRALDAAVVEHREQVGREVLVAVGLGRRRGRRRAVAAGVVGDHAVAVALERARAHDDVTAGGGQPVQQDHGRPLAGLLAGELHAACLDDDLGHAGRSSSAGLFSEV